jgi:Xaa-Pro aminopeptidase
MILLTGVRMALPSKTISVEELKRRWAIVRDAMKREKLDFILAQNSTEYFGWYVRWLTGLAALTNHPVTVIFPYDDEMTIIWSGPGVPDNLSLPGVKKKIDVTVVPSLAYNNVIEAEKAVGELGKYANCHVGLANQGTMSAPFHNFVTRRLRGVKFSDVTDVLDEIKAVKSNEEIHVRLSLSQIARVDIGEKWSGLSPSAKSRQSWQSSSNW